MCKNVCARAKHVQLFSHVQLSGCALELIFFGLSFFPGRSCVYMPSAMNQAMRK